jgi:hypothetical protein
VPIACPERHRGPNRPDIETCFQNNEDDLKAWRNWRAKRLFCGLFHVTPFHANFYLASLLQSPSDQGTTRRLCKRSELGLPATGFVIKKGYLRKPLATHRALASEA